MADHHKVLQEMQMTFPKLPADLVKSYVVKYSFDREKCLTQLAQLQMTYKPGPNMFGHDMNQNNPLTTSTPGMERRTSYPVCQNGNHENLWNDPIRSAPALETPFQYGNQSYSGSHRPIHQTSAESPFALPRIPSPTSHGGHVLRHSPSHISPNAPRHPSPVRSPNQQPVVTSAHQPLHLTMPKNSYEFQDHYRESSQQQQHPQQQHISTLEISPGMTPFQSSQFLYYTGPSQQPGGNHKTSFNVQIPSATKQSLTTQIFVQTSLAPSPHHYTPVSTSPRYQEPVLMVPSTNRKVRPEAEVGKLPVTPTFPSKEGEDEKAYTEALLLHQKAGYDLLMKELAIKKVDLQKMKLDLMAQEQEIYQRRSSTSNPSITSEDTRKLCQEIRKLRVDCQCMSMEVDLLNSNQVLLGVTDENFYKHIFPGQAGNLGSTSALMSATTAALAVAAPTQPSPPQKMDLLQNGSSESRPQEEVEEKRWKCPRCTFCNHPFLTVCEICEIPRSGHPICGNGPARETQPKVYVSACDVTPSTLRPVVPRGCVRIKLTQNLRNPGMLVQVTHEQR